MQAQTAGKSRAEWLLTGPQLAQLCELTARQLRERFVERIPPQFVIGEGNRRRYRIAAVGSIWRSRLAGIEGDENDDWSRRELRAKALLAEHTLAGKRRDTISLHEARRQWDTGASVLRRAGERIERTDPQCAAILSAALDEWERLMLAEEALSDGDDGATEVAGDPRGAEARPDRQSPEAKKLRRVRRKRNRAPRRAP